MLATSLASPKGAAFTLGLLSGVTRAALGRTPWPPDLPASMCLARTGASARPGGMAGRCVTEKTLDLGHGTTPPPHQGLPRRLPRDARARALRRGMRPRARAARPDQAARVAAQRMRVLHRHALEGRARARRDRTAALRPRRVARGAVLQRAGTRRS